MYYYIKGKISEILPSMVVIEACGVGYAVNTSYMSASSVKKGSEATFYTYLHVREDNMELFGFASQSELSCFKQLLNVSGVGPSAALAILSTVTPEKLSACIASGDETTLCTAPKIGKKLAQRIILELRDKLTLSDGSELVTNAPQGASTEDAVAALVSLGYQRSAAVSALSAVNKPGLSTDELIRAALKKLF